MRVLEIKQGRLRNYGAAQKGDLAYVLTQLINDTGAAMVRKVDTGFEVCAFHVIKDITPEAPKEFKEKLKETAKKIAKKVVKEIAKKTTKKVEPKKKAVKKGKK